MADRLLTAATVFSLLGSLGIYAYSMSIGPVEFYGPVPPGAVGTYIALTGMAREVRSGWDGGLEVELLPGGKEPGVWLVLDDQLLKRGGFEGRLLTGARFRASGVLQQFRGRMELRVEKMENIRFLAGSSLNVVWNERELLNGSSVRLAGVAFYKKVWRETISFRILDPSDMRLELNCSSNYYRLSEEKAQWSNGSLVRVSGVLRYLSDPPVPRLYLAGGARGVEPEG